MLEMLVEFGIFERLTKLVRETNACEPRRRVSGGPHAFSEGWFNAIERRKGYFSEAWCLRLRRGLNGASKAGRAAWWLDRCKSNQPRCSSDIVNGLWPQSYSADLCMPIKDIVARQ